MSDLDRLIADEQARSAAQAARTSASAREHEELTRKGYETVESVLRDAAARMDPWKLVNDHERVKLGLFRSLPPTPPVFGWVFPFSPGWGEYGMALTIGGRIVLMYYNEGNEKHPGKISILYDPYPPYRAHPAYHELPNPEGVIRYGAPRFPEAVASAIVRGSTWYAPMWGRYAGPSDQQDPADFIRGLAPRLDFAQRQSSEI